MLKNWWHLGNGFGYLGEELALYRIECPFCEESGNYELVYRAQKKQSSGRKELNFDTYKCNNCSGFVQVIWAADDSYGSKRLHDYRVQPWPLKTNSAPEHWPPTIQRYWIQAQRSLEGSNWDAASVMARSALQVALRDHNATGKDLKSEIKDLADKGILPPLMKDWSDEVKDLGNNSAHPKPEQEPTNEEDAKDVVEFLDFLLIYLYNLPKQIKDYRDRKLPDEDKK
jgi:hypothetical protein